MADLTPERLAELRRIAEAATPGPWIKDADKRYSVRSHWNPPRDGKVVGWRVCVVSGNGPQSDADWDYITEFNPKTAMALLDEISRLQQKVQRANALAVAVDQALKAWSMGDYLTPFMDDLRNALLDFEGPVASEDGGLEVATDGEEGGVPDVPERCWYCERALAIESIRIECAYCGADVGRAYEWLDAIAAARAEAERWKQQYEALWAGGAGTLVVLTQDDCNTLMHGLRRREELEDYLLPEALEHYERLATRIIDMGVGWSGGAEDA